jgi:hypothetical protein
MCTLNDEEMESSFKIDLRDVLWWKSIKDACKPGAPVIVKFSKERCISLATRGRPSHATCKQVWAFLNLRNLFLQIRNLEHKYGTTRTQILKK